MPGAILTIPLFHLIIPRLFQQFFIVQCFIPVDEDRGRLKPPRETFTNVKSSLDFRSHHLTFSYFNPMHNPCRSFPTIQRFVVERQKIPHWRNFSMVLKIAIFSLQRPLETRCTIFLFFSVILLNLTFSWDFLNFHHEN